MLSLQMEILRSQGGFNLKYQSFLNIMMELNTVIFLMQSMVLVI